MQKYRLNRSFLPWLGSHFFEFILYYIGAFLCLYLLHYFQGQIPLMAKELGDLFLQKRLEDFPLSYFGWLALAIITFRTLSRLLFFYPARIQQKILRLEILGRLEQAHPSTYQTESDGQIYQIIFNDFNRLRGLVGFGLLQIGNIIIAFTVFIPKINSFHHSLLIAFSPMVFGVVVFSLIIYFFQKHVRKSADIQGDVQNFLIENYDAKQTIKNFHSEKSFLKLFSDISAKELHHFYFGSFGQTLSTPLMKLCFGASLLWGAYLIKLNALGATAIIFFSGFLFLIMEPISYLSWIGVITSQALVGWKRIKELLEKIDEKNVKIENLIKFENDKMFLPFMLWNKDLPLNFVFGRLTAITGETGSGKTYLLKALADQLYLRKEKFSLVMQEPYFYNDTLMANLFYGKKPSKLEREQAWDLIQIFGLDHLEPTVDEILKLEIGENGKRLSGGQAKRLAIIRSLLSESKYLLWDDPFSSVDIIMENQIIKKLKSKKYLENKTIVLTSHRFSTIKYCDDVYLISKDGLEESGDVKNLLNKKSKVSSYFEKQLV